MMDNGLFANEKFGNIIFEKGMVEISFLRNT